MDSFLKWVGGKRLLRKEIINRISMHHCYVEPFGGAAWVLFYKEPSKVEIYNDINSDLVDLFKCVKYHPEELQKELKYFIKSRELFNDIKDQKGLTEIQRVARFLYLIRYSFGGIGDGFGTSTIGAGKGYIYSLASIEIAAERLNQVIIEHLDFEECIRKYDSEKTFFYCDPPYFQGTDYSHVNVKFTKDDHLRLANILENIKGKWLLSYDDCEDAREIYKKFIIEEVSRPTGINRKHSKNPTFKELLIRNYKL